MALFGKKKEEAPAPAPPIAPPVAPLAAPALAPAEAPAPSDLPDLGGSLSTPPLPGASLDDIKSQVTGLSSLEEDSFSMEEAPTSQTTEVSDEDDTLFDLSDFQVPDLVEDSSSQSQSTALATSHDDSSFLSRRDSYNATKDETYYVTTSQFKALLEIVDAVKNKVKESSETHLRLLDIKAEEDIEYENLRKDFQFIEDKLYEVDSIIFEK